MKIPYLRGYLPLSLCFSIITCCFGLAPAPPRPPPLPPLPPRAPPLPPNFGLPPPKDDDYNTSFKFFNHKYKMIFPVYLNLFLLIFIKKLKRVI